MLNAIYKENVQGFIKLQCELTMHAVCVLLTCCDHMHYYTVAIMM